MGKPRQGVLLYDCHFRNASLFVFVLVLVCTKGVGVERTTDFSGLSHLTLQMAPQESIYSAQEGEPGMEREEEGEGPWYQRRGEHRASKACLGVMAQGRWVTLG